MLQRHVLIVDSDKSAALVTQRVLEVMDGHQLSVEVASPGVAWLRCLRTHVDLLVIDPAPQSLAAYALIKALHEECPDLPILVLTAYDTPRLRSQMRELGVRHYLAKPIDLLDLQAVVARVLQIEHMPRPAMLNSSPPNSAA